MSHTLYAEVTAKKGLSQVDELDLYLHIVYLPLRLLRSMKAAPWP